MQTDWHALEFTKTRGWEARDRQSDDLADYGGLVGWCERRGLIHAGAARRYRAAGRKRPVAAASALREAHGLRRLIYQVLRHVGTGKRPTPEHLRLITGWIRRASSVRHLAVAGDGAAWTWRFDPAHLDDLLMPIAWSLSELMVAPELSRVRHCDGDACGWLFVDGSRAGTRRWCDMSDCGNLDKVRRFRARSRPQ